MNPYWYLVFSVILFGVASLFFREAIARRFALFNDYITRDIGCCEVTASIFAILSFLMDAKFVHMASEVKILDYFYS